MLKQMFSGMFKDIDPGIKKLIKTFGIIIGVIAALFIALLIIKAIIGEKVNYDKLESIIEKSAIKYLEEQDMVPKENESSTVNSATLINAKYMKPFEKYTDDTNCSATVIVENNGGLYLPITNLSCDNYTTKTLYDELVNNVVESGNGLYKGENEYYFRGEYPKNYINLAGNTYRILNIDSDKNVKLIMKPKNPTYFVWDDRYNNVLKEDCGINDFAKSRLLSTINSNYSSQNKNLKKYIKYSDWCIGKRKEKIDSLTSFDCDETYKLYMGSVTVNEVFRASVSEECISINTSCRNYNYLSNYIKGNIWTLNAAFNNTNKVVYVSGVSFGFKEANNQALLYDVFKINGMIKIIDGDGSSKNPYSIVIDNKTNK